MAAFLVYGRAPGYRRVVFDGGMNAGACSVLETGEAGVELEGGCRCREAHRTISRGICVFSGFFPGVTPR